MARQHIGWKLVQRNKRRLKNFMIEVERLRRVDAPDKHHFALPRIHIIDAENVINDSNKCGFFAQFTQEARRCRFTAL